MNNVIIFVVICVGNCQIYVLSSVISRPWVIILYVHFNQHFNQQYCYCYPRLKHEYTIGGAYISLHVSTISAMDSVEVVIFHTVHHWLNLGNNPTGYQLWSCNLPLTPSSITRTFVGMPTLVDPGAEPSIDWEARHHVCSEPPPLPRWFTFGHRASTSRRTTPWPPIERVASAGDTSCCCGLHFLAYTFEAPQSLGTVSLLKTFIPQQVPPNAA